MDLNNILAISAIVISASNAVFTFVNHKRIRSKCCSDKEQVISIDVESTTPPKTELFVSVPQHDVSI
jgi:hypothetical protein